MDLVRWTESTEAQDALKKYVAQATLLRQGFEERRWSRGESNSRPNKEPLSLLHVYSMINFRKLPDHRQPNNSLAH
ncbi:MAG: hypothetical protein ACI9J3_001868 [Parvicellaceae bacterium]|jgi:hypothetical protein